MTKKFWKDWQKRIGETKNIQLFWFHPDGRKQKLHCLLNNQAGDRIIKFIFNNNTVALTIERHNTVIDWETRSLKQHVENEYKTINREEIATIEFLNLAQ
jgi:molybdopterin-guanine dinucleotide biosynthesis protein A